MKKLILLGLCMFLLVGIVNAELVYQETPNETSGSVDCSDFFDGNWDTGVSDASPPEEYCYANYTKIDDSTNTTFWEVKDDGDRVNLTILNSCWDYDNTKLIFRIQTEATGGPCLDDKTKILTPDGYKIIKDLEKGDKVYSFKDGQIEEDTVKDVWANDLNENGNRYYYIFTKSKLIKATWNHKFYTNGDYLIAENLKIGNKLLNSDLKEERVIFILKIPAYGLTYDLVIENNSNFFANDILVHNAAGATWYCLDGSWQQLRYYDASAIIDEEAVWWNTTGEEPPPPPSPQFNITSISKTSILTINKGGMLTISK